MSSGTVVLDLWSITNPGPGSFLAEGNGINKAAFNCGSGLENSAAKTLLRRIVVVLKDRE